MIFLAIVFLIVCLFCIFNFMADGKTAYTFLAAFALIAPFFAAWKNSLKKEPSKMVCPNCGGEVKITSRVEGVSGVSSSQFNRSYVAPNHHATINRAHNTRINRQRVAVCQTCGFDYPYVTKEEILQEQKNTKSWAVAVVILALVCMMGGGLKRLPARQITTPQSTAATTETPTLVSNVEPGAKGNSLDDFSFSITENGVSLESYMGKAKRLIIESSYEYGGAEYKTDLSNFQIGTSSVESLILSEGITEVKTSIFNSSDVKNVFFPASMACVYDYTLSYIHLPDGERAKIFYAGTQEEWNSIFTEYQRKAVKDADFGEEMGTALADVVNQWIGANYDSALFDYYFSATPEMVP